MPITTSLPVWNDADAAFYAEHLAASNYRERLGATLRAALGPCRSLLDIGAGSGLLGVELLQGHGQWTALEPNSYMRQCLRQQAEAHPGLTLQLHDALWQSLPLPGLQAAELVLCANIPVADGQARALLERARPLARRALVWNLPAQQGPRSYCLSGFLPATLHRSDTTPGYLLTLAELGTALQPDAVHFTDWSFSSRFARREDARAHFLDKLGPLDDQRLRQLDQHLERHLQPHAGGWLACAAKRAASLIWYS